MKKVKRESRFEISTNSYFLDLDLFLVLGGLVTNIVFKGWLVKAALFKILKLYDKNPWRNRLSNSKLATFDPILQLSHSALFHFNETLLM